MKSTFKMLIIGLAIVFSNASIALGGTEIELALPLDCKPGVSCFVIKYVDTDPSEGAKDFECGPLSNDGHSGTDIRLLSYREMEAGVNVLAAADGKVVDARDGMPDVSSRLVEYDAVTARGFGNRITIRHANGYITNYAHLKRGSVKFKKGDMVKQGQILGQVGMSGLSEFPHLHFDLVHKKKRLDPFSGVHANGGCGNFTNNYWNTETEAVFNYEPTFLISAGFSQVELNRSAKEYQLYDDRVPAKTNRLLLNVYFAGARAGDEFSIQIFYPNNKGILFDGKSNFKRDYFTRQTSGGKNSITKELPKGTYVGKFILTRGEQEILNVKRNVEIY